MSSWLVDAVREVLACNATSLAARIITAAPVPRISQQAALDRKMFGPVYHGTHAHEEIARDGFKVFEHGDGKLNGYPVSNYGGTGLPAPIDHLGFGVYFTTSKTNAQQFNGGTARGLKTYYIDAPRMTEINFGAESMMMKWWERNGYDIRRRWQQAGITSFADPRVQKLRIDATRALTDALAAQYDAIWYKGKGLRRLLDGDQVVVFDPSRIYEVDPKLATGLEVGAKVRRKSDGMTGVLVARQPIKPEHRKFVPDGAQYRMQVKWKKGGTDLNVFDVDVEPVS